MSELSWVATSGSTSGCAHWYRISRSPACAGSRFFVLAKSCFALPAAASISYQFSLLHSVSCISLHTTANTSYYRTAANAFCSHPTRDPSHYRRIGTCSPHSIPALTTIRGASTLLISSSLAFFTRRSSTWPHHWTTRHSSSTCTEGLCQPTLPPWTT